MRRFRILKVLRILVIVAALLPLQAGMLLAKDSSKILYKALSPWGDTDPRPLKGISPRIDSLSGKKIGLFANYKRASIPIALSLKARLEKAYPDSQFSVYHSDQWNVTEIETENSAPFKKWVEGNDAVILMVGD